MDLQEGIAVGRSFSMFKNYHIDGNKEMIAFGTMNIVGSFTSCYLTTGTNSIKHNLSPFSLCLVCFPKQGLNNQSLCAFCIGKFRAIFEIRGELQCRMQNGSVEHRHGNCRHVHFVIPHTLIPLHSTRCSLSHHYICNAWPHWLWSRQASLEGRQVRLRCVHECLCWCGFWQCRNWFSPCGKIDIQTYP